MCKGSGIVKILFRNILFTLKNSFTPFFINIVIHCAYGVLPVISAYLWKNLIEYIQGYVRGDDQSFIGMLVYILIYSMSYGLAIALPVSFEAIDTILRNSVKKTAQTQIHEKMERMPYVQFEDPKINDYIVNSSQTMVNGVFMFFSLNVIYFVSRIISLGSSMILLYSYSRELILVYPVLLIPVLAYGKATKDSTQTKLELTTLLRKKRGYEDYISDVVYAKETRILDCSEAFLGKRNSVLKTMENKEFFSEKKVALHQGISSVVSALAHVTALAIGVNLMQRNLINVAEFASVISLTGVIAHLFNKMLDELRNLPAEKLEIEAGFKLLDMPEGKYDVSGVTADKEVLVNNVSFKYPFSSIEAISNINMQVRNGQIIAIVGENGAGKSTFVKVLLGLYEPSNGSVLYDKRNINEIKRNELFGLSSAVFEDYNKYALNIEENVSLSDNTDIEKLRQVMQITGVDCIILKYEDKEKTFLGKVYGGEDLSGGEWQKIALARGYYKDSRIVVLDEPTASLDPIAEYNMYLKFKEICKNRIGIIVTHRIPAASLADYIYYFKAGKIIEEGTHAELIRRNGDYAKTYSLQKELFF